MSTAQPAIPADRITLAAIDLLNGVPLATVIDAMVAEGIDEGEAARACAALYGEPAFGAGQSVAQQRDKLHGILARRSALLDVSGGPRLDRRSGLSRDDFLHEYYARNEPVLIEDACENWRACEVWTPDYLVDRLGSQEVEVMADRDTEVEDKDGGNAYKQVMPFDEFIAKVVATDWGNDLYLVANNRLLGSAAGAPLWDDFQLDPRYLTPDDAHELTYLWLGPAGTITRLHHDVVNVFFSQVDGYKHFTLVSPLETPFVYNRVSVYSDVDPRDPDYERFPDFARAHPIHVTIGPGESLFVPVGWWHQVEALDPSISISATGFVFPNDPA